MPWRTTTPMSQRYEFVILAEQAGLAMKELCRRFGISRKSGYKWLQRYREGGPEALRDRSRRPKRSPALSAPDIAQEVIKVRLANPVWGGRKLRRRLQDLGHRAVPAASTCTEILRRAELLSTRVPGGPMQRFEREAQPT